MSTDETVNNIKKTNKENTDIGIHVHLFLKFLEHISTQDMTKKRKTKTSESPLCTLDYPPNRRPKIPIVNNLVNDLGILHGTCQYPFISFWLGISQTVRM